MVESEPVPFNLKIELFYENEIQTKVLDKCLEMEQTLNRRDALGDSAYGTFRN